MNKDAKEGVLVVLVDGEGEEESEDVEGHPDTLSMSTMR
jgi:hypothetical protein